jgi:hypothetical protein
MKFPQKKWIVFLLTVSLIGVAVRWMYASLPINRADIRSELIMLGDLNNDKIWDEEDKAQLNEVLKNPFRADDLQLLKIDINKNQLIDAEDTALLNLLFHYHDPYAAERNAPNHQLYFPRPRELFKYLPKYEYVQSPLIDLRTLPVQNQTFTFINAESNASSLSYREQLRLEIQHEALRFLYAYNIRRDSLTTSDIEYFEQQITSCNDLYNQNNYHDLLLNLVRMVEEIETLDATHQDQFVRNLPLFRSHLRSILTSPEFKRFRRDSASYQIIFAEIEKHLHQDLGINLKIDSLERPRDFSKAENYIERAEWQKNKSLNTKEDFAKLVLFAQYDRRYLRAVSKTSQKNNDLELHNHNLPMLLLFQEALRIKHGDKKAAIGLLDEAIRIPYAWIKRIPSELLPSSIALDNFLLPGNKEDGSDKSRHWNVFGGVALYKTPREALILSIQREVLDAKDGNYSPEAVTEFVRDLIANTNGIYYVVSFKPDLVYKTKE